MESQNIINGNSLTFLDIIENHKIEIPVIQRDYAQGRKSRRINPIRKKFIKDLIEALKDDSGSMHLNFVYGRIEGRNQKLIFEKNKEAIENILLALRGYAAQCHIDFEPKIEITACVNDSINSKFIPLDGQQRITTLYLLHWYILQKIEIDNKENLLKQLRGFSYNTRVSTKEFCEFLIKGGTSLSIETGKSISEVIEESPDFFRVWKRDPSVEGMLTTLDEIHNLLKSTEAGKLNIYWNCLSDKRRITFDFLDLDEYEQTDELYVKMNARGKQLTDFEHFKSWLHDYIKSNSLTIYEQKWSDKIDTTWLDLFWKYKTENTFEVDAIIYNFIKSINLYEYVALSQRESVNAEAEGSSIVKRDLIDKIRDTNEDKNYISTAEFEESKFFNDNSLNFTFNCLNKLSELQLNDLSYELSNIALFPFLGNADKAVKLPIIYLSNNHNPTLPDRVFYYAFLLFITDNTFDSSNFECIKKLKKWMRICRNIIYNTYIQNPDNFIDAIKAIKDLSIHKFKIEEAICKENFSINFFDGQLKEEIHKIIYFSKSEYWEEKIMEVENHPYFYGQIEFIFNLLDNKDDYQQFEFYCDKLSAIFNDPEANDFLFHRLLLSKGDYLVQSGGKYSFCDSNMGSLRARQDNWRKVFNDPEKLGFLKKVLEETSEIIISDNSILAYSDLKWESFFIKAKYIENLNYLGNKFIVWEEEWNILLLEKSTLIGKHADLYSHTLYLDLTSEGFKAKYISVNGRRSESNQPMIELELATERIRIYYEPNHNNEECAFVIEFKTTQFFNTNDFEVHDDKLISLMNKSKIVEGYQNSSESIIKLLRSA